jgi:hypothetical protein
MFTLFRFLAGTFGDNVGSKYKNKASKSGCRKLGFKCGTEGSEFNIQI